jgi:hypothetical protein
MLFAVHQPTRARCQICRNCINQLLNHWQFEVDHGGGIYITENSKWVGSGLPICLSVSLSLSLSLFVGIGDR